MKTLTIFVLVSLTFLVEVIKGEESEFSGKWITIATCRAKCLHKFVRINFSDQKCFDHKACFPCWNHCEIFHTFKLRTSYCSIQATEKCNKGCKTACNFYTRHGNSPVRAARGQEWVFPVRASVRSTDFREMFITWTRPRLISPKTHSVTLSRRVAIVYVLLFVEDFGQEWRKLSVTCNTREVIQNKMDPTLSSDVLLVAVSTRGELARQCMTVNNRQPSKSKTIPSPGVVHENSVSSNKTHKTFEQFLGNVAAEVNSNSTLATSVQSFRLPVKSIKPLQRDPNVIWILTTALLVMLLVCAVFAIIYFTPALHCCLNCCLLPINFTPANLKLNSVTANSTRIEDPHVGRSSSLLFPPATHENLPADVRCSTPTGEHTQHTITVDVHHSENPASLGTQPQIPVSEPDTRQDSEVNTDCGDERTQCSLKCCEIGTHLREDLRRHIVSLLSDKRPPNYLVDINV